MSQEKSKQSRKSQRKKYVKPGFSEPVSFNRKSLACGSGPLDDDPGEGCTLETSGS